MHTINKIRWGRILAGAVLIEVTMFAIVVPLNAVRASAAYYSVPALALVTAFVFGRWVALQLHSHFVLHGIFTAVAASIMYIVLTAAMGVSGSIPLLFHFSHGLRILGGAAGGALAGKQARGRQG
jgi:hypothetical protein